MKIIVTGAAGFIGYHVVRRLLDRDDEVVGLDNLNAYYDPALKDARLAQVLDRAGFTFERADVADPAGIAAVAARHPDAEMVIHLAAQAGVRHSLNAPLDYVGANVMGQMVMLEMARGLPRIRGMVYASSSSVYGRNEVQPFSVRHETRHPASIYAATKLAAEHLAEAYAWTKGLPLIGLRFFTVYGPWGRPDMAPSLFADAILKGEPIRVFNHGRQRRDFTFIDDIVAGVIAAADRVGETGQPTHRIYNLGNNRPVELMRFIALMEQAIGREAIKRFEPAQPGDVVETAADIAESLRDLGYSPRTSLEEGLPRFVDWYRSWNGFA